MAKTLKLAENRGGPATIEVRGMTVTPKTLPQAKVYEIVDQLIEWGTECQEEEDRLRSLCAALNEVGCEALNKKWIPDDEHFADRLEELSDMWEARRSELRAALRAYDDAVAFIAEVIDRPAPKS